MHASRRAAHDLLPATTYLFLEPLIQPRPQHTSRSLGHTVSDRSRTLLLAEQAQCELPLLASSRTQADAQALSGGGRAAARSQLRKHTIMERAESRLHLDMGSKIIDRNEICMNTYDMRFSFVGISYLSEN